MTATSDTSLTVERALVERLTALLYSLAPATVFGSLLVFAINFAYYGRTLPPWVLYAWAATYALSITGRVVAYWRYRRGRGAGGPARWRALYAATAFVHGVAWAILLAAAERLLPPGSQTIAIISVTGLVGAAVATISASRAAFAAFVAPLAGALPIALLPFDRPEDLPLVLLWLAWYVFLSASCWSIHRTLAWAERTRLEKEALVGELERLSERDPLTGLYNRRRFEAQLETAWSHARRTDAWVGLLLCDVDFFKQYNDAEGHRAGDDCLCRVADRLEQLCRSGETLLARYGGEEFVVLLPQTTPHVAASVADRLQREIEASCIPHPDSAVSMHVTISVGVAALRPQADASSVHLLHAADEALYRAKSAGRNRVEVSSGHTAAIDGFCSERRLMQRR